MKIVINSHVKSTIALEHLLESMRVHSAFHTYEIFVMIGGFYANANYDIKKDKNITYVYCNFNSIDFTGLIALSELYAADIDEHYFYMHDTCKVGPTFFQKLASIDIRNVSSIRINQGSSMNIGIYSQRLINTFKQFLIGYKNTIEAQCLAYKARCIKDEDYLFIHDRNNSTLNNFHCRHHTGPTDYYKTGTMRIVEYYANIDIYKIKANWGQGNHTLKN